MSLPSRGYPFLSQETGYNIAEVPIAFGPPILGKMLSNMITSFFPILEN
jgi:hypothetical protein